MSKIITIEFSVQDQQVDRKEYNSIHDLQKLLNDNLKGTNWRLMSDGISYRLGLLKGKLKGVEGQENLRELITKEKYKKR
jgi:hypothetical protein